MHDPRATDAFTALRPQLLGLAYRILGSLTDAEDAVQDTFLRWDRAERESIENPDAWLTTICTRRSLDLLRAAHRSRVDYVGAWLPEPIHTPIDGDAERDLERASSLTTAFLLVLERLTPKERAAYLLHDIFDASYQEVAETLEIQQATCRQLVARARAHIEQANVRHRTAPERQEQLLAAFNTAVSSGATEELATLLSDDVRLSADGGGKVPAARKVLEGKDKVLGFVAKGLNSFWAHFSWHLTDMNGGRAIALEQGGATVAVVTFAYDEHGRATDIFIVRNPDKLSRCQAAPNKYEQLGLA